MATVFRDPKKRSKIQYITTNAFNTDLYVYTTSRNPTTFEVTGSLTVHPDATSGNCPIGRVLRETGRTLYPGGAYSGISTFMVGVYDAQSGLNGFIDPNTSNFAYYNIDKPIEVQDGTDPTTGAKDKGMSVYTNGSVRVWGSGNIYAFGTGSIGTTSGNITSGGTVVANTGLTVNSGGIGLTSGNLTITAGKLNVPASGGAAIAGTATLGAGGTVTINTTAVTASSRILLTYTVFNTPSILRVSAKTAGTSFTVTSLNPTDTSTFDWFIVN